MAGSSGVAHDGVANGVPEGAVAPVEEDRDAEPVRYGEVGPRVPIEVCGDQGLSQVSNGVVHSGLEGTVAPVEENGDAEPVRHGEVGARVLVEIGGDQ